MSTIGYYDEIAKIEKLRKERLSKLRQRLGQRHAQEDSARPQEPNIQHAHHRKLPQRKAWTN